MGSICKSELGAGRISDMAEEDAGQDEIEAWLGWEMTNSGHSIEIRTQVFT